MDETTDIGTTKQLAVMVQYLDPDTLTMKTELLEMIDCEDGCAESLANSLLDLLKSLDIPVSK